MSDRRLTQQQQQKHRNLDLKLRELCALVMGIKETLKEIQNPTIILHCLLFFFCLPLTNLFTSSFVKHVHYAAAASFCHISAHHDHIYYMCKPIEAKSPLCLDLCFRLSLHIVSSSVVRLRRRCSLYHHNTRDMLCSNMQMGILCLCVCWWCRYSLSYVGRNYVQIVVKHTHMYILIHSLLVRHTACLSVPLVVRT